MVPGYAGELLISIKESAQAEVTRATASNEPAGTVKSRLSSALRKLREVFAPGGTPDA